MTFEEEQALIEHAMQYSTFGPAYDAWESACERAEALREQLREIRRRVLELESLTHDVP